MTNPSACGLPADSWSVAFQLDQDDGAPTPIAWEALRLLALIHHDVRKAGRRLILECASVPDVTFCFVGNRATENAIEPDELADALTP
jgi:hypothetical protein